jgi:hypothetical protein
MLTLLYKYYGHGHGEDSPPPDHLLSFPLTPCSLHPPHSTHTHTPHTYAQPPSSYRSRVRRAPRRQAAEAPSHRRAAASKALQRRASHRQADSSEDKRSQSASVYVRIAPLGCPGDDAPAKIININHSSRSSASLITGEHPLFVGKLHRQAQG